MKKVLALVAIAAALTFVACNTKPATEEPAVEATEVVTEAPATCDSTKVCDTAACCKDGKKECCKDKKACDKKADKK